MTNTNAIATTAATRKQFRNVLANPNLTRRDIHEHVRNHICVDGRHSYGWQPDGLHFYGQCAGSVDMGVENECTDFELDNTAQTLCRYLHDTMPEHIYCKSDTSIRSRIYDTAGVEMVSHPATLAYHMRKFGWADVLQAAELLGAKSHDASAQCGLHVHVNRNSLGNTLEAQQLCVSKLLIIMDRFYETEIFKLSRRPTIADMAQWASKNDAGILPTDKRDVVIRKAEHLEMTQGRYHALNLTNSNTVEFRFFRGTLNPTSFAAALQFIDAIVRYCKTHTLQECVRCRFGEVVSMCKYPELYAYCNTRNIDMDATGSF